MRTVLAAILLLTIPLALSAGVIIVGQDVDTVEKGVLIAEDGDTLLVPSTVNPYAIDDMDKDLTIGLYATEPPDYDEPDSTIYGTNSPCPQCPDEP